MAKVLLTSVAPPNEPSWPYPYDELNRMRRSATNDRFGIHNVTTDPAEADVILYVENCDPIRHYLTARGTTYLSNFADKCFLFSRYDFPIPFLPGVYASIPKRWHEPRRTRSGPYLNAFDHDFVVPAPTDQEQDLLYSFAGKKTTHPIRQQLFALDHPKQYLFDTSPYWPYGELSPDERTQLESQYVNASHRSKFILCPRGRGASSIRLFEALRMGRPPVVISDAWVPPQGPDWESFSVRVREDRVSDIPKILESHAPEAVRMGRAARHAWENWFAEPAVFHRVTEWCLQLKTARRLPDKLLRLTLFPQLLHPTYFKALMRHLLPDTITSRLRS